MLRNINARDILTVLFKHRGKIVIGFFVIVAAVVLVTLLMDPVYQADSSILVKLGREYIYHPEVGDKSAATPFNSDVLEGIVNAESEILDSPDLADSLIRKIGVKTLYPDIASDPPRGM